MTKRTLTETILAFNTLTPSVQKLFEDNRNAFGAWLGIVANEAVDGSGGVRLELNKFKEISEEALMRAVLEANISTAVRQKVPHNELAKNLKIGAKFIAFILKYQQNFDKKQEGNSLINEINAPFHALEDDTVVWILPATSDDFIFTENDLFYIFCRQSRDLVSLGTLFEVLLELGYIQTIETKRFILADPVKETYKQVEGIVFTPVVARYLFGDFSISPYLSPYEQQVMRLTKKSAPGVDLKRSVTDSDE